MANPIISTLKVKYPLKELGILKSQLGQSIYELDYEELKYELVLSSFKEIDITRDAQKWF